MLSMASLSFTNQRESRCVTLHETEGSKLMVVFLTSNAL